jgi:acyl-CoA synthetase (AMP-forming)/AMP-acid ligase II
LVGGVAKPGCVGRPLPGVEVRLLDEDGAAAEDGDPGEICVRGPNLFSGYWPDGSGGPDGEGWYRTGDVAYEDDDGDLVLVDRRKELVIVNGFNVYPREVEDVLMEHPALAAAAVIGTPDPRWGEAVRAIVTVRPGAVVDPDELKALVRRRKGPHYAPKAVDVVSDLPMTPVGKIDKKALRAPFWAGHARQVH